ncbi:hypothetical protein EV424DRAFT_467299 [Suillus variegatus]|nr:hypothetical protein EV424DRAFT_467299 [Suillus variegatus]
MSICISKGIGNGQNISCEGDRAQTRSRCARVCFRTLYRPLPARISAHSNPRCTLSPPLCASTMAQPHRPRLDRVCAAEVEHADSFRQRHVTELFLMQFSSNACLAPSNFRGIVLLATAESQTSAHSLLHTPHGFKDAASIPPAEREARKEILASVVSRRLAMAKEPLSFVVDESDPPEYARLAVGMEGYSPVDLRDLVTWTVQVAVGRAVSEVGVGVEKSHFRRKILWRPKRDLCLSLRGCALTKVGCRVG